MRKERAKNDITADAAEDKLIAFVDEKGHVSHPMEAVDPDQGDWRVQGDQGDDLVRTTQFFEGERSDIHGDFDSGTSPYSSLLDDSGNSSYGVTGLSCRTAVRLVGNRGSPQIPDSRITASSYYSNKWGSEAVHGKGQMWRSRLDYGGSCWQGRSSRNQWIQWDFGRDKVVTRSLIKGRRNEPQHSWGTYNMWVRQYKLFYKKSGGAWKWHRAMFPGPVNGDSLRANALSPPVRARWIRLYPQSWSRRIAVRADFDGCDFDSRGAAKKALREAKDAHALSVEALNKAGEAVGAVANESAVLAGMQVRLTKIHARAKMAGKGLKTLQDTITKVEKMQEVDDHLIRVSTQTARVLNHSVDAHNKSLTTLKHVVATDNKTLETLHEMLLATQAELDDLGHKTNATLQKQASEQQDTKTEVEASKMEVEASKRRFTVLASCVAVPAAMWIATKIANLVGSSILNKAVSLLTFVVYRRMQYSVAVEARGAVIHRCEGLLGNTRVSHIQDQLKLSTGARCFLKSGNQVAPPDAEICEVFGHPGTNQFVLVLTQEGQEKDGQEKDGNGISRVAEDSGPGALG